MSFYDEIWQNWIKVSDHSDLQLFLLPCRAGGCRHSAPGPASQTQQVFADADYWAKSDSCTFFENSRLKNKNLEPV